MRPSRPLLVAPLLAVALAAAPAAAQAVDPAKLAAAQPLFEDAQAAMDRKDYATACPKLEEVVRLLPSGVGGLLTLARCYEGLGKLARAWSTYLVAGAAASQAKRPEVERQARDRVAALKPRLAQLSITVSEATRAVAGLSITRDGTTVGAAQWGTPVPIDVGRHMIVATAPGKQRWERAVDVTADGTSSKLDVGALVDAPVAVAAASSSTPPADRPEPPAPPYWGGLHIAGATVAALGVVGLAVGGALGGLALSKKSQSNNGHCVGDQCDTTGAGLRSSAITFATGSTAGFVAGSIVLAGGIAMLAIPVRGSATVGTATLNVTVGARSAGLRVVW